MSHTKVEIKITEGCDENGVGGTVTAYPIAVMPQQVWENNKDAWADARGWTETIPNPDFNPNEEVSESNPETITNPTNKAWNVTVGWRERSELLIRNYQKKVNVDPVIAAVNTGVNASNNSITVTDGTE